MHDGNHLNRASGLIYRVDYNIGRFQQFARSFDQTRPAHARKASNSQPIDAKLDAPNQFGGCAGAIFGNPVEYPVEVTGSGFVNDRSSFTEARDQRLGPATLLVSIPTLYACSP
jgi:hypothetical protein